MRDSLLLAFCFCSSRVVCDTVSEGTLRSGDLERIGVFECECEADLVFVTATISISLESLLFPVSDTSCDRCVFVSVSRFIVELAGRTSCTRGRV